MSLFQLYVNEIIKLCENHEVQNLYAFGSILTPGFSKDSDVDLIVDFKDRSLEGYADNYFELKSSLEQLFKRSVDLLEEKAIKNPFFKQEVLRHRQLIYAG